MKRGGALYARSTIPLWGVKIVSRGALQRLDRGYDARDRRVQPEPCAGAGFLGFLGAAFCERRTDLASVAVF